MFLLKATFLSLCVILGGGHAQTQEPCQSLRAADAMYDQCVSLGNCTGMTCESTINNATASTTFVVDKCTDPLRVNVSVDNGTDNLLFSPTATGLQVLTAGDLTLQFNITRNASTAWIQASMSDSIEVIPSISVPLNQTDCMCESLSSVADSLTITDPIEASCMVNQQCSGIDCGLALVVPLYIEADIQPCEKPPGVLLVVRNSVFQAIYEGYFNSSDVVSVVSEDNVAIQVNVKIMHRDYSMNVEVDVTVLLGVKPFTIAIVPSSWIIVDKTQCSASTSPVQPAPPSEAVSTSTCGIITDITANSQESGSLLLCYARADCDGMTCKLGDYYTTDIQALACSDPPRFYVKVTRIDTHVFSDILTKTTTVDLGLYGQLKVVIVDYGDEISIEVDLLTGFFSFTTPLSPVLRIPKDYCLCSNADCPTTAATESPTAAESSNNSATVAVAVTLPVIFIVLVIVLVLTGVIVFLIWRQQKLHISFQKMSQDHPLIETFHKTSEESNNIDDTAD